MYLYILQKCEVKVQRCLIFVKILLIPLIATTNALLKGYKIRIYSAIELKDAVNF